MASPSPVTDGATVIAHFGNGDLAAYDFAGNRLWLHNLQKEHGAYTIWWGHANSPVLWKELVISVCMQDSVADLQAQPSPSYLVAHDKRTGEQKWKVLRMTGSRAEDGDAYTTPILYRAEGGTEQLIVVGGNQIDAYDPATGKQLWYLPGLKGSRTITGPTLGEGLLFCTEGKRGSLLAVRLGGEGQRGADAIIWKRAQATPDSPSPVLWKGLLFLVSDDGFAQCLDARTGEVHWKERLPDKYKASPLAADDKVYFLNLVGRCTVVAAAPKFEILRKTSSMTTRWRHRRSPMAGFYLRGKKALYCIGKK